MSRFPVGEKDWAEAAERVYNSRNLAIDDTAKCPKNSLFCECEGCKALPERPEWMRTPEDVVNMAARLVKIVPDQYSVWDMYGVAHWDLAATMPEGTWEEKDVKIPVMTKAVTGFTKSMVEARKAGNDRAKELAAENMREATTVLQALKP